MIDKAVFTREISLLQERFGRELSNPVIIRYLEFLNDRMTTLEFESAAREIFNRDTFWPSPVRFLEAVRGDPQGGAEDAWAELMDAAAQGKTPVLAGKLETAVRAVGGFREIMYAEGQFKQEQLRKQFVSAFKREAERELDRPSVPELPA